MMKLQQPNIESISSSTLMDEVSTILQCGVVLLLGYAAARAWLCYRRALVVKNKLHQVGQIDFDDGHDAAEPANSEQKEKGSRVSTSPIRSNSSRQANAQLRKRMRRRRASSESLIGADGCAIEGPAGEELALEACEEDRAGEASLKPIKGHDQHTSEIGMELYSVPPIAEVFPQDASSVTTLPTTNEEKIVPLTVGSAPAEVPEIFSGGACEVPRNITDCVCTTDETPPSDAKPSGDSKIEVDKEEESQLCEGQCEVSEKCASAEGSPQKSWADIMDEEDALEQEGQEQEQEQQQLLLPFSDQSQYHQVTEMLPSGVTLTCAAMPRCQVDWDLIESDSDDDDDAAANVPTFDSNHAPETAPILWCSQPQTPMHSDERSANFTWVPVAIPAECAPPGTLDGRWMNRDGERILIEKLEIMFESGVIWSMKMHSPTCISVDIDGAEFSAELMDEGEHLMWSDGDVWEFHGRVHVEEQPQKFEESLQSQWFHQQIDAPSMHMEAQMQTTWCYQAEDQVVSMEPLQPAWEAMPLASDAFIFSPDQIFLEQPPPKMPSLNEMMPTHAKEWEICWDWKKKGRCPRGASCDWYHPPASFSPCQACETPFFA